MKKKIYFLIGGLIIVLIVGFFVNQRFIGKKSLFNISSGLTPSAKIFPPELLSPSPLMTSMTSAATAEPTSLPEEHLIENFSFQSQAPFGEWDELHDEACEEAALILVNYYLKNQPLDAATMEEQIQKMVAWEIDYFGSYKDLTIDELQTIAQKYYGLQNSRVEENITLEDIKKEVAQNHSVIVPTAGRLLGNPYFRSPGPIYHMLVIIGYEGNTIIVQDIGTRRGDHYRYNQTILFNAIHNWAGTPENIEQGEKTMLVFD